jgi:uncharacterized membrane protein
MQNHVGVAPESTVSRARLEFLFDGIFAIAMTILVLDLKVPESLLDRRSGVELGETLMRHAATFGSYMLSFAMLGIMWYRHNRLYRYYARITGGILFLQLSQLAFAAFFPFCASLLGRFPLNPVATIVYVGCLMIYQWGAFVQWGLAHRQGAMSSELTEEAYTKTNRRNLRGAVAVTIIFAISAMSVASRDIF